MRQLAAAELARISLHGTRLEPIPANRAEAARRRSRQDTNGTKSKSRKRVPKNG